MILDNRGREKDFFIQVQGIVVGHGGDDVTNSAVFGMIILASVHLQFFQVLLKDLIIFEKIDV